MTPEATWTPTQTLENDPTQEPSQTVSPTLQPDNTPTVSPSPTATFVPPIFIPVGPGSCDVIPHQIVRAQDDHLYLFSIQQYSPLIRAFTTTNAGFPYLTSDFTLAATVTENALPISLDAAYDGNRFIHILTNTYSTGHIKDYPFDTVERVFRAPIIIATNGHTMSGDYLGTSGITGMFSPDGKLHLAFWTNNNRIQYQSFTYDETTNTLAPVTQAFIVDTAGSAIHPVMAISPVDYSITIAWISEATAFAEILVRTLNGDTWSGIEKVSAAPVWSGKYWGISIDQGPSMLIDSTGKHHLAYIETWDYTRQYGRVHYVYRSDMGWVDQALANYSHNPALALNSRGELYLIGHGHPNNITCQSEDDMCYQRQSVDGAWSTPELFAQHSGDISFDSSPSTKWSVVGWNRPEVIEFVFFGVIQYNYSNSVLYYGRLP